MSVLLIRETWKIFKLILNSRRFFIASFRNKSQCFTHRLLRGSGWELLLFVMGRVAIPCLSFTYEVNICREDYKIVYRSCVTRLIFLRFKKIMSVCISLMVLIGFFCFIFVLEHCFCENSYYIIITSFLKLVPEGHTHSLA